MWKEFWEKVIWRIFERNEWKKLRSFWNLQIWKWLRWQRVLGMKIRGNLHICLRRHMVFRHWNFEDCLNNGRTYEKSIWTCRKYLRVGNRRDEDTGCVWWVGNQLLQGKQKSSCSKKKANWIIRKKLRNYKMHSRCSQYNTHEHQQNLKYYEDKIWLINQLKVIYWMHKKRNRVELQFYFHTVF